MGAREPGHVAGEGGIDEAHAGTVEAGIADHLQLSLERLFHAIRTAALHGPERLIDQQALGHVSLLHDAFGRLCPPGQVSRCGACFSIVGGRCRLAFSRTEEGELSS